MSTLPSKLFSVVTYITNSRFANTISNSLSNIRAHYDLSNGMFAAFLSKDMTYSCGIFSDLDADLRNGQEVGAVNGAIGLRRFAGVVAKSKGDEKTEDKGPAKGEEVEDELEAAQLRKIQ